MIAEVLNLKQYITTFKPQDHVTGQSKSPGAR